MAKFGCTRYIKTPENNLFYSFLCHMLNILVTKPRITMHKEIHVNIPRLDEAIHFYEKKMEMGYRRACKLLVNSNKACLGNLIYLHLIKFGDLLQTFHPPSNLKTCLMITLNWF